MIFVISIVHYQTEMKMRLLNFISNLLSVRVCSVLVLNCVVRWCCSSRRRLGGDLCPSAMCLNDQPITLKSYEC